MLTFKPLLKTKKKTRGSRRHRRLEQHKLMRRSLVKSVEAIKKLKAKRPEIDLAEYKRTVRGYLTIFTRPQAGNFRSDFLNRKLSKKYHRLIGRAVRSIVRWGGSEWNWDFLTHCILTRDEDRARNAIRRRERRRYGTRQKNHSGLD